ncbi:MAG: PIN domain-containing protein [Acidimicrobiia bacterium]
MARELEASAERLILDSGAVIALARSEQRALAFLRRAIELDADVVIPVVVLAETLRGGRTDAAVHRALNRVGEIEPTHPDVGRVAGRLLGASRSNDTVDAMVVAEAVVRGGGQLLTSDPSDLRRLAASEATLTIQPLAGHPASRRRG